MLDIFILLGGHKPISCGSALVGSELCMNTHAATNGVLSESLDLHSINAADIIGFAYYTAARLREHCHSALFGGFAQRSILAGKRHVQPKRELQIRRIVHAE